MNNNLPWTEEQMLRWSHPLYDALCRDDEESTSDCDNSDDEYEMWRDAQLREEGEY